ncbi:MAG: 3-hydroxybutyrate dehydrogenase [Alphaproteobacteria bacterium]|nr:3-hydroxybutyrate dehydrogenase [Alphaproteobacteria bacterium]
MGTKRSAIVTGSTSGIGQGIAIALMEAGHNVMLNGFGDKGEIEAFRAESAKKYDVKVAYSAADMTKPEEIAAMVAAATQEFGQVDILVNNAGIQHVAPIEEFPPEKWNAVLAINLTSAFHATRAVLPQMQQRGWGRIINVASAHGLVASAQKSAYVASKHGIVGFTKVTALENAEKGITCNAICPGWVLTPLVQKQIEARAAAHNWTIAEASRDLLSEKQPSKSFVQVEELGALAVFLSGELARSITGTTISMDGGWTAQ